MLDILNPHAILLKPSNYHVVLQHPTATSDQLERLYSESLEEKEPLYIVFKRAPVVGTLMWMAYTTRELEEEFDIIVEDRFATLEKI